MLVSAPLHSLTRCCVKDCRRLFQKASTNILLYLMATGQTVASRSKAPLHHRLRWKEQRQLLSESPLQGTAVPCSHARQLCEHPDVYRNAIQANYGSLPCSACTALCTTPALLTDQQSPTSSHTDTCPQRQLAETGLLGQKCCVHGRAASTGAQNQSSLLAVTQPACLWMALFCEESGVSNVPHDSNHKLASSGLHTPETPGAYLLNMTQYSLFTQVPSGKMSRGVVSGDATCAFMRSPTRRRSLDCRGTEVLLHRHVQEMACVRALRLPARRGVLDCTAAAAQVLATGHVSCGAWCNAVIVNQAPVAGWQAGPQRLRQHCGMCGAGRGYSAVPGCNA